MKPPRIEVNIEELVLHGFDPRDRYRIGEAVEQELTRLFTEKGVPPGLEKSGDIPHLDGGSVKIESNLKASKAGVSIARSVYGGLRK